MVMVPATVSNNIPGSDLSIGADTALNAITQVTGLVGVGSALFQFSLARSGLAQFGQVWPVFGWTCLSVR